jgi:hypothetical protein
MFPYRRPEPSDRFSWTSPWRHLLPCRLGGVLILALIIAGCTLPTEDVSDRAVFTSRQIEQAINQSVYIADKAGLKLLDNRYRAYTESELLDCLDGVTWIASLPYIPEDHDCEEYMFDTVAWVRGSLHGIPFGFGLRETETCHAENLFIDEQLNVWIVDLRRHGSELIPAAGAFFFLVLI